MTMVWEYPTLPKTKIVIAPGIPLAEPVLGPRFARTRGPGDDGFYVSSPSALVRGRIDIPLRGRIGRTYLPHLIEGQP